MKSYKPENKHKESEPQSGCKHHWIIEIANGSVSRGVCKYCGFEKEFLNSLPDFSAMSKDSKDSGFCGLPEDAKPVEEQDDSELDEKGAALRV